MQPAKVIWVAFALAFVTADARSLTGFSVSLTSSSSAVSDSQDGSASAGSEIVVENGHVAVEAHSLSLSLEQARDELVGIKWRARKRVENGAKLRSAINGAARASARAIAETLTTVSVSVESSGEGNQICADTFANATANARALAEVFVDVFLKDAPKKISRKERRSQVKSVSAASAEAASTASASACLEGEGQVSAFQEAYASAVTKVYAAVVVNAFGEVEEDDDADKSFTKVRSRIEEDVQVGGQSRNRADGKGKAESDADGFARVTEIEECSLRFRQCCNGSSDRKARCTCGYQCTMKPIRLGGNTFGYELIKAPFGHEKGFKCYCEE